MNVNLDKEPLKRFKFGGLLSKLYKFEVRWYQPTSINQPYQVKEVEVRRYVKAIKNNARIEPVVVLKDEGIIAGIHLLEAFKKLKYERIPILYGRLK